MTDQEQPLRIIRLEAENVKRLRAVHIQPDGALVVIGGRNGQGKTSILDSIQMALGGAKAVPSKPVRDGEEGASVVLDLGDLVVKRTFRADGKTTLRVESQDGARFPSPQAILDRLTGELSFDPLAFARMDSKAQAETLRRLVGVDLTPIDEERQSTYEERTVVNRELKRLEAQLAGLPKEEEGVPDEPISVGDLARQLEQAQSRHDAASEMERDIERARRAVEEAEREAESKRQMIARLQAEVAELDEEVAKGKRATDEMNAKLVSACSTLPDLAAIREQLAQAETVNERVRVLGRRRDLEAEVRGRREEAEKLTKRIADLDRDKRRAIAEAKLPVEGLSFHAGGVLLDGIPFDQASSAEQLRVSVAMGLAMNPRLRVLLIRDGSLLDEESLRLVAEMADEAGAQVWIERVGDEGTVSVVIEDGAVRMDQAAE